MRPSLVCVPIDYLYSLIKTTNDFNTHNVIEKFVELNVVLPHNVHLCVICTLEELMQFYSETQYSYTENALVIICCCNV
jgi:hypothetical protein